MNPYVLFATVASLLQISPSTVPVAKAQSTASVVSFSPTGSVKSVQQAVVRFSTDMVAMGDPRAKVDPFTVKCNEAATQVATYGEAEEEGKDKKANVVFKTRWADNKSWILDFDKPLPSGYRCIFKLNGEAKDLAGTKIEGLAEYSFTTAGPALLGMAPIYGQIEPEQYFVALTDGAIDPKSVQSLAYFEVEGIQEKVGVKIVDDKNREAVIKAAIKNNWRWNSYEELLDQSKKPFAQIKEMENFVILSASRRFPENKSVVLHWPKGILSKSGLPVEEAQDFKFQVIEEFLANFTCERVAPERPCNPILDMQVRFTKRLPLKSLKGTKLVAANGKSWTPLELMKGDQNKNAAGSLNTTPKTGVGVKVVSNFEDEQVDTLTFKAPFPESTKFKLVLAPNLKDEIGRKLSNQLKYPLETATDEYLPLIKFPGMFGMLELKADPLLPVSVRNIEKQMSIAQAAYDGKSIAITDIAKAKEVIDWYIKVQEREYTYENRGSSIFEAATTQKFQIPKPGGEREFELVGIPLKKSGFYVVEMSSPKLGDALIGKNSSMYVSTSVLVTDMAVHFKKGIESSVVWVTQLSNSKPVNGAKVVLLDRAGKQLADGTTDKDGILKLNKIDYPCTREGESYSGCEVFAFAQKGEDFSFTSSEWEKGIESYRFNLMSDYTNRSWGPVVLHSVLDRMAVQPGEAVQMKHVLREHRSSGFAMMDDKRLPKRVLIVHEGSQKTYTLPFEFDKSTGTAVGKFSVPKDATLGQYAIYLSNRETLPKAEGNEEDPFDYSAQKTGSFVVAEYRLPLMKANVKVQGSPLVRPNEVKVDLSANYLSGGPARGLKVKVRSTLQPGSFTPPLANASDYTFFSDPIKAGIVKSDKQASTEEKFLKVLDLKLGEDGGLLASVPSIPAVTKMSQIAVEMEYSDPNGEIKTAAASMPVFPATSIVGFKSDDWFAKPGKTKTAGVVTGLKGEPLPNRSYVVNAFQTNYITHRKRLVGGFYSYDSKNEVVALGKVCEGKTDSKGQFSCEPKGLPSGSITLQAETSDDKGRKTYASIGVNIFEAGADSWWTPTDSDRIDLLPEKPRYEPNETARIVVRTPFPTATALITVEREGVLESYVREIKRDNPIIEVPMKGNYAPNVYISVLLVRGRVGDPKPTALIDLAKPSMKMGAIDLKVGWKAHELLVTVKSDRQKYQTREKVQVTVQVKTASGEKLPEGSEVAIAAVDEALMNLKENSSWKILTAMMGQRGLAVRTSSGQNQVIGRRHFGSKAKPPGGGGGAQAPDTRELFDPILMWRPKVKLDEKGEAKISVPLNDSLTSFRIVAVALGGAGYFGDGKVNVEATKDLIIYSGIAPLVRDGDQIKNQFTIRNTTSRSMKVSLEATSKELPNLPKLAALELKANEAKVVELPVTVPAGLKEINLRLAANDASTSAQDSMLAKVKVVEAVPPRVLQATLFQLEKTNQIPVKQPADAIPGRGGLRINAKSTLVTGLAGVKSYMSEYSYTCLEQKVSKGVVLEDREELKRIIESLPGYVDGSGLLKFFPVSICGSAQLTRYVMNILNENGFTLPTATVDTLTGGLTAFVNGQAGCRSWWDELVRDQYANEGKLLVLETLSRYKKFNQSLLSTVKLTPNLWKTETVVAWYQLLKRESQIPNRDAQLKQADQILKSRVNFQGSLMNLQNQLDWEAEWRLFSSRDQEATGVFGISIDEASWAQDVGRMARGITARLKKGRWDTTMANAWGLTQLRKFSAKFEKEKVAGETKVTAAEVSGAVKWASSPSGEQLVLPWPKASDKTNVNLQFNHAGAGKPWIHLETISAIALKSPMDLGYKVVRKITPVSQKTAGAWSVGDVANVELTVTAKNDQPWVVIRDAIPGGAAHLGTGLDGSSNLLDRAPKKNAPTSEIQGWPTEYEEKRQAEFVSYAAYLPKGTYRTNYRIRLNSAGEFKLPPSRVEAMYSPETFGEAPNANWKVAQ